MFVHWLCLYFFVTVLFPLGETISPNPNGFHETQPDGTVTPPIFLLGSEDDSYMADEQGNIVVRDENNWLVYASLDESGAIGYTGIPVGHTVNDGRKLTRADILFQRSQVLMNVPPKKTITDKKSSSVLRRDLKVSATGKVNNLVILVRFSDHKNRTLPSASDYALLFNSIGGDKKLAPTGSLKDYYLLNSYGALNITSFIYDWILVPFTESTAKQGSIPVVTYVLNYLANTGFSFSKLGGLLGQKVHMVSVMHSGYGAEWGGTDCFGVDMSQRVWSHQSSVSWKSADGIFISDYSFTTGLWDVCGSSLARLGMIVHETGHVFGLPDLYDNDACGVGSYDVMSNCWGFDGSQLYPPMFSPWSKIQLGWVVPIRLSSNGTFTISQSANTTMVYRLDIGFPLGEYLLLENRQNIGFDRMLAQGGLAVWHIDENADRFNQGYPGQSGWPANGNHYSISLLQADGLYELEHGDENWGKGDLYRADFVREVGPSWQSSFGPFPNTDRYQGGKLNQTGIRLYNVGPSASSMSFSLSFGNDSSGKLISTSYINTTNSADGNMFTVQAKKALTIKSIAINVDTSSLCPLEVWVKAGTYVGYQQSPSSWTKIASIMIQAVGVNTPTPLPENAFGPIPLSESELLSFYVTFSSKCGTIRYCVGTQEGIMVTSTQDISILEGSGNIYPFRSSMAPRIWSGSILYDLQEILIETKPTKKPNLRLTKSPTVGPTKLNMSRLATTFSGGSGLSGCMFTIQAKAALTVKNLDVNVANETGIPIEVWTMKGSFIGYESKKSAWRKILSITLTGAGVHRVTRLGCDFPPVLVAASQKISFYVTSTNSQALMYSDGSQLNNQYSSNNDLIIMEGKGVSYPFGKQISPKVCNGAVLYTKV